MSAQDLSRAVAPPNCGMCGGLAKAGVAGGPGNPPLLPVWVCEQCKLVRVVGEGDIVGWWIGWTRGTVGATGDWLPIEEEHDGKDQADRTVVGQDEER